MKQSLNISFITGLLCLMTVGCSQESETTEENETTETAEQLNQNVDEKSAVEQGADYATGVTQIRAGEKAKDKIKNIQNQRNQQMQDALED